MKIAQNAVVEFCYELEVDGQVVDHTTQERPLDYIHGTGSPRRCRTLLCIQKAS